VRAQSHEQRPSFFLGTLLQDVSYALRQLRKNRGFTVTAVLTLALGIGANAAIFTLVNAILLKNLPVVDPSTLIRIGNTNECCVNYGTAEDSGAVDDGSYALFDTDTWQQLQKNAPEFEELAAMQSGLGTVIARSDKTQEAARSVTGEFVSGNYFRTFGLQPSVGRLFTDADNVIGAPLVAVMSYNTWQNNYAGDPSIVGSTFWINTKAVTITGIVPKDFFGDRLSSSPPDFYLPIESVPVLTSRTFVHEPGMRWLYIIGRVKPGVAMAPLQAKITELVRQSLAPTKPFSGEQGKRALAKFQTFDEQIADSFTEDRMITHLMTLFSILALLLANLGLYGVTAYTVARRTSEIGIRMTLGANRCSVVSMIMRGAMLQTAISLGAAEYR
jgi:macrolide transport system ATP-binding/permease protein